MTLPCHWSAQDGASSAQVRSGDHPSAQDRGLTASFEPWVVRRRTDPFPWVLIENFLPQWILRNALDHFPSYGFRHRVSDHPDSASGFLPLVSSDRVASNISQLDPFWDWFAHELTTTSYKECVGTLAGVNGANLRVDAALFAHQPGAVLQPHTDRPHRILTQTIYLHKEWKPEWGGALSLLLPASPHHVTHKITPKSNRSVLFRRSNDSWHAMTRLSFTDPIRRQSLLFHLSTC
jgi:2OG-Fe(II) oxygenase superfamily